VTADVANITAGSTSVVLTAGSFTSPGGVSFSYRSSVLTSDVLADGARAYTVDASDSGGNTSTNLNNGTVTLDTTGPAVPTPGLAILSLRRPSCGGDFPLGQPAVTGGGDVAGRN